MIKPTLIALKNLGKINPESIEDYKAIGGYSGLRKALRMDQDKLVQEILRSGLRGRGGAGFTTGIKDQASRQSFFLSEHYIICNADEGEPGTFKDRIIMENDPHSLLESLLIAAYMVGATSAYIYIRGEYTLSIQRLTKAINQAKEQGYIGNNILDSDYSCSVELRPGAGSYLCGEELTMIESLEGKRGYPRIKPPFPAEKGLWGKPTLVNNVETLVHYTAIVLNGSDWYRTIGTERSPGTKIFNLSGMVNKPGFYEVETGITLHELIFELGEGIKNNNSFKAALLGGAAGTFTDGTNLDVSMGYDLLKERGLTLGSGAVIVLDTRQSVYDMLVSILKFFKHESCGKCVPCRLGCEHLVDTLKKVKLEPGRKEELLVQLEQDAVYMARTSLCPLGQSPILPIRSAIKYFKHEF